MEEKTNQESDRYLIPASIVVAGVLVAAAVFYSNGGSLPRPPGDNEGKDAVAEKPVGIQPVTSEDHVLGNPEAPVKMIEFSDLECPFCKRVHPTLTEIMDEFGKDGRVAWVYRHFPLDGIHPKADKEAEASECAAELGGNGAFWRYISRIYEVTPSNNGLDTAKLPEVAAELGLDRAKFEACLASGKYAAKVEAHTQEAAAAGGNGTPYTVIVAKNGKTFPVSGAQSYAVFKETIEEALQEK